MIHNLDELIAYTTSLGDEIPALRESCVINRPGCSVEEIDAIKRELAGIPQCYLDVVKAVDLDGIAIGYFRLSPGTEVGLANKLISTNQKTVTPIASRLQNEGVYQVAAWDADPIGVVFRPGKFETGQIVKYNIGDPQKTATVLAENFVQFLLLAGNLDAVRQEFSEADDPSDGIPVFDGCLDQLLSNDQARIKLAWRQIAEVVLG